MANSKTILKQILRRIRPFREVQEKQTNTTERDVMGELVRTRLELDELKRTIGSEKLWAPTGHFYSPIPALAEIESDKENIFEIPPAIRGVHLNEKRQIELLTLFCELYREQPFTTKKAVHRRYYFENPNYSYTDALVLYCMMRYLRPRRIVEVGSGFSSCAMLDVNELFFDNSIACTFIDPYPQLLRSLIKDTDRERIQIIGQKVQDVDVKTFRELNASDILFIDSSHVSKTGSDVNYIVFKILPLLKEGVYVHFHDIQYPFEYPEVWIQEGRSWNEAYLLRAFLQYNTSFDIEFFATYLLHGHRRVFETNMPLCLRNEGANLWLKKSRQDPELDRVTAPSERKPKVVPSKVDPSRPDQRWLLGEGWHGGETDHCWMEDRASLRIAAPASPGQNLHFRADNPHIAGVHLSVTIDEIQFPPVFFSTVGRVETALPLPMEFVGRSELQVSLAVDKRFAAPPDPRNLGLSVIDIEVR